MYKNLYRFALNWIRGGNIWFYSDPHFKDEDVKFFRKNNISDEEQVKRINSKVGKNDTIVFLGDIGNVSFIEKIKGYKVLVLGNHDSGTSNYLMPGKLFDEVYEGPVVISEKIILSHEPLDIPYMFNIHGHVHSLIVKDDKNHFNVCAEHIDYLPISINDIIKSGKLKHIKSIHRITVDNATERKQKKYFQ